MTPATRLTTDEARAYLGGIARSTLWAHYGECRVAVTGGLRAAIAWDREKLDRRQQELARQSARAKRSA